MTPGGGGERPAVFARGFGRKALRTLAFATALFSSLCVPPSAWSAGTRTGRVPTIYHKSRSFRIPFSMDASERSHLDEVQLWVSDDSGFTWKAVSRTSPDRPTFTFRASKDAEFWFAVRTLDKKGNLSPSADDKVEPGMKVIVDTTPPSIVLEPDGRRGSLAAVRWEVRDEHLDLKSLTIEYQVEGGRDWRSVPIRRPALIGSESWDASTAEMLKVRATVSDRAGNVAETSLVLPEGTPANPALSRNGASSFEESPPVSPISSGPNFLNDENPFNEPASNAPAAAPARSAPIRQTPAATEASVFGQDSNPCESGNAPPATSPLAAAQPASNPSPTPAASPAPVPSNVAEQPAPSQTEVVNSPRFPLRYEVNDAGPNGPASVELWVTTDGGRTWYRRGEDPDRVTPYQVDLGGEGTFGLRLVARGASGLGDQPPAPGDLPHLWVEVDSTAPIVELDPPVIGSGAHLGKVAVRWRASDVHLAASPVTILWRPVDAAATAWQKVTEQPVENTGKFIWTVPSNIPPRFYLRVEVVDAAGNRGSAETPEGSPVLVDRTRPRSKIIGLDPSARNGVGPAARSLR